MGLRIPVQRAEILFVQAPFRAFRLGADGGQSGGYSGPQVLFGDITIDLPQATD